MLKNNGVRLFEAWACSARRFWAEGLVWRFGWETVVDVRFDTVELVGPFEEPS